MKVQTDKVDMLHLQSHIYHFIHIFHTDAKLILSKSGSDICMGMCTYIGVDTKSNVCHFSFGSSQFVNNFQFRNRFYVKTENVIIQSKFDLPIGFPHTGKYNLLCWETSFNSCTYFAATYTIGTQSTLTDDGEYLRVCICFHSIMHVKMFVTGYFFIDSSQCVTQHFCIIIIKRGTQLTKFINREYSFHKRYFI